MANVKIADYLQTSHLEMLKLYNSSGISDIRTISPQTLNCLPTFPDKPIKHLMSAGFALSAASEISRLYTVFFRNGAIYFVSLTYNAMILTTRSDPNSNGHYKHPDEPFSAPWSQSSIHPCSSYSQSHILYQNDSTPTTSIREGTHHWGIKGLAAAWFASVPPLQGYYEK
ncbi:hypothetical protein FA15DRAFT_659621 [Coprinopsis marcescibilis]|uniref:Uncharacterized protein n=1 Tax=Coprinopsis marcescibilis TaxID=230819 RepID=A0A5C3KIX5_COPMA|nr:hypothetical protein FA15DRAFT_659621 [Coprinopsis marcescibilis]